MGEVTGTAEIQRLVTQNLGADLTDIDKKIAEALHKTQEEVTQLFNEAAAKNQSDYNWLSEKTGRPLDKSVISQITQAAINTAQGDLDNITGTIGFLTRSGQFSLWDQAYRQALSFGSFQVASGATSYTQAAREIINQFAGKGMMIEYASGQRRTVETAVRLCITSGVGRMAKDMAEQNGQMLGADGVEISAHAGSAPDHEPYQGRQYTRADFEAIDNMLDRPFEIWNCRHIVYPVILGLSQPVYTEAELNAMAAENAKGITYEGKHYTLYEATQMQRQIERSIRGLKRELIGANAAKDQELFTNDSIKMRILRSKYEEFSRAAGLPLQNERAQVYGYGRSLSAKVVSTEKAVYEEAAKWYNNSNRITNAQEYLRDLKGLATYQEKVPDATLREYLLNKELHAERLIRGYVIPTAPEHAYILEDPLAKRGAAHIMKRMLERNITQENVQSYIDNAVVAVKMFQDTRLVYYSENGVAVLTNTKGQYKNADWVVKTAWKQNDFDEKTEKIIRIAKKYDISRR